MLTHSRVIELSAATPNRVFCYFYRSGSLELITYRQLLERSVQFAEFYLNSGIRAGDNLSIILKHSPDLYSSFIGAMLIGAVPCFLPFATPKQDHSVYWRQHNELLKRNNVRLVITFKENLKTLQQRVDSLHCPMIATEEINSVSIAKYENSLEQYAQVLSANISPKQIAFLQHSSGTTGLKKGVILSHEIVARQIESYAHRLDLKDSDCIASWLPIYHDMGLIACTILPMMTGVPFVAIDPFEWVVRPKILLELVEKHDCTLTWLPNFAFHHLINNCAANLGFDLSSLRAVINCSEPCNYETFERFYNHFQPAGLKQQALQVCYAMAETVFAVTQTDANKTVSSVRAARHELDTKSTVIPTGDRDCYNFLSAGTVIDGIEYEIVDADGSVLSENQVGEIVLFGDFLFSGYFNNPEETSKRLRGGKYYTRDRGFTHKDELYVIGRIDDIIITHGKNISAHDVEYVINSLEHVKPGRVVVFGLYLPNVGSQELVALIESELESEQEISDLKRKVKRTVSEVCDLSLYDVRVVPVGKIFKTTSGKLNRESNRCWYINQYLNASTVTQLVEST